MAIYSNDNPTEDGMIYWDGENYIRISDANVVIFGAEANEAWLYDHRGYVEWDVSALFGKTLLGNPFFKYEGILALATDGFIAAIEETDGVGEAPDEDFYVHIGIVEPYVYPFDLVVGANQEVDLGELAREALQYLLDEGIPYFNLGFISREDEGSDTTKMSAFFSEEQAPAATPKPTLYVEYEEAVAKGAMQTGKYWGEPI